MQKNANYPIIIGVKDDPKYKSKPKNKIFYYENDMKK
jgi:hypothetical protein